MGSFLEMITWPVLRPGHKPNRGIGNGCTWVIRTVLLLIMVAGCVTAAPGQGHEEIPVDRVVADVGGTPVTLREAMINASLLSGRFLSPDETGLITEAIQRCVEQAVILKEWESMPERQAAVRTSDWIVATLEKSAGGMLALKQLRAQLQMGESEWQEFLTRQTLVVGFINERFRPFVYVSPEEVRKYFTEEFCPRLGNTPLPELDSVKDQITLILTEKKINDEIFAWLDRRKTELKVKVFLSVSSAPLR